MRKSAGRPGTPGKWLSARRAAAEGRRRPKIFVGRSLTFYCDSLANEAMLRPWLIVAAAPRPRGNGSRTRTRAGFNLAKGALRAGGPLRRMTRWPQSDQRQPVTCDGRLRGFDRTRG
jgi:hypothetical protein